MEHKEVKKVISFEALDSTGMIITGSSASELAAEMGEDFEARSVEITAGTVTIMNSTATNFTGKTISAIFNKESEYGFTILTRSSAMPYYIVAVIRNGIIYNYMGSTGSGVSFSGITYPDSKIEINFFVTYISGVLFNKDSNFIYIHNHCCCYSSGNSSILGSYFYGANNYYMYFQTVTAANASARGKIVMYKAVGEYIDKEYEHGIYDVKMYPQVFLPASSNRSFLFYMDNDLYMLVGSTVKNWCIAIKVGSIN